MPLPLRFALFFLMLSATTYAAHRYLYHRTVHDLGPSEAWRRVGRRVWIALGVGLLLALPLGRLLPPDVGIFVAYTAFCWMGVLAILLPMNLVMEPLRFWLGRRARSALALPGEDGPADPGRRLAMTRMTAAATTLGSASVAAAGVTTALDDPDIVHVEVRLDRLPAAFDGYTIVQLSDIHVGPTIGQRFTERLVERIDPLAPDAVVITGDLVDGPVPRLIEGVRPLSRFRTRDGIFFCTGNHEYYSGVDAWCGALEELGVRVLRNARHTLQRTATDGGAAAIDLIGVDDWSGGGGAASGFDVGKAVEGRDPERCAVLLCHQPRGIHKAAEAGLDLVLSGHTHGGQIWPYGYFVALIQPYVQGLHRHDARTQIYVNPGTGYWGPPMRVKIRAEITHITLRSTGRAPA
ncbi:MAG: metallophosphoesterase [Bradymonadia bacterium]